MGLASSPHEWSQMSVSLQEAERNLQVPARSPLDLLQPPHPPPGHTSGCGEAAASWVGPEQNYKPAARPAAFHWPLRWAQNRPPENHPPGSSLDREENPGERGSSGGPTSHPYALARAEPTPGSDKAALGFVLAHHKTPQLLSPVLPLWGYLQLFLQFLQATSTSLSLPPLALPLPPARHAPARQRHCHITADLSFSSS